MHWQPPDSSSSAVIHWINQALTLWCVIARAEEGAGNYKVKKKKQDFFFFTSLHVKLSSGGEKGHENAAIAQAQLIYILAKKSTKTVVKGLHQALLDLIKTKMTSWHLHNLRAHLYHLLESLTRPSFLYEGKDQINCIILIFLCFWMDN